MIIVMIIIIIESQFLEDNRIEQKQNKVIGVASAVSQLSRSLNPLLDVAAQTPRSQRSGGCMQLECGTPPSAAVERNATISRASSPDKASLLVSLEFPTEHMHSKTIQFLPIAGHG